MPKNPKQKGLNKKEKKQVKSIINQGRENKYLDVLIDASNLATGVVYSLADVPQGDTDTTRDGDQLVQRAMRIKGRALVADTTNQVRMIVFRWKQNTVPVVGDILSASYIGTVYAPLSPYHHDGRSNFTVLYDKIFHVGTYNIQKGFDTKWMNLRNNKQYFSAGASTSSKHCIYALVITDSTAVSNPNITFVSRLTFTDS